MIIFPHTPGDIPIGRALRDIKDGEVLTIWFFDGWPQCEAIEFFYPFGVVRSVWEGHDESILQD